MGRSDERSTPALREMPGRREFLRGIAVAGAAASAGSLLAACSSSPKGTTSAASAATPRRGGSLKVGLAGGSTSDTLDPHKGLTYLDTGRFEALYQPLVKLNKDAKVEYVLAESITPNASLSEWTIRLRPHWRSVMDRAGRGFAGLSSGSGDVAWLLLRGGAGFCAG